MKMKMKCACGYENKFNYETRKWDKKKIFILVDSMKIIRYTDDDGNSNIFPLIEQVYICPKCGTLKINI